MSMITKCIIHSVNGQSAVSDLVERSMMCRYSLDDGTTSPPNQSVV
jgi:hypothetical protein